MNTYAYNINGEVKYLRAKTKRSAWYKIFHGELNNNGSVDMNKIDLKQVDNPRRERFIPSVVEGGNKVFNNLRHI